MDTYYVLYEQEGITSSVKITHCCTLNIPLLLQSQLSEFNSLGSFYAGKQRRRNMNQVTLSFTLMFFSDI
jgi:hypothetical protein